MSNYQFPPSSPLLDGGHGDELPDPFANITHKKSLLQHQYEERGRYPTPNPSSTTGRSSSPVRDDVEIPVKSSFVDLASKPATAHTAKKNVKFSLNSVAELKNNKPKKISKVRINRDFNILDPDANVLRVPLNLDGTTILVGRSSKSCDYHFNTSDRTISRSHLGITYTKDGKITIECLGFSGFGMRVPKACLVYGTDKANDYILLETSGSQPLSYHDLRELGLAVTPRTISLDSNHTEFFVNRYERVTLPKINNIFIQVRDHVMLLNPVEDEEDVTEDEMPELVPSIVLESAREKEEVAAAAEEEEETEIGNEGKEVVTEEHAQKLPVSSPSNHHPHSLHLLQLNLNCFQLQLNQHFCQLH